MAWAVTINAVDRTTLVQGATLRIQAPISNRGTCSFTIVSEDGSYIPELGWPVVVTKDAATLFTGVIERAPHSGFNRSTTTPIATAVQAVDNVYYLERRLVTSTIPAGTLEDALDFLEAEYFDNGLTLDAAQPTGPNLPELTYTNTPLSAVLNDLATRTGYIRRVDFDLTVLLYAPGAIAAPFDIADDDGQIDGDLDVEPSDADYANRVVVVYGPDGLKDKTVPFTADGSEDTFQLPYPIAGPIPGTNAGAVGYAIVNVPAEGGNESIASVSGAIWLYDHAAMTIQRVIGGAPAAGDFSITFEVLFPQSVSAEDAGEISARGLWERRYERPDIEHPDEALQFAEAQLALAIARPRTLRYPTTTDGLRPGQEQAIEATIRQVDATCIIQQVNSRDIGGGQLLHEVTAIEGTASPRPWQSTISGWSGPAVGPGSTIPATPPDLNSAVKFASVTLTHAQILTLDTAPTVMVPAPGAGFVHVPIALAVVQNFTVGYGQSVDWAVTWTGAAFTMPNGAHSFVSTFTGEYFINRAIPTFDAGLSIFENKALEIATAGLAGISSGGDAANELVATVAYFTVDVSAI